MSEYHNLAPMTDQFVVLRQSGRNKDQPRTILETTDGQKARNRFEKVKEELRPQRRTVGNRYTPQKRSDHRQKNCLPGPKSLVAIASHLTHGPIKGKPLCV